MSDDNDKGQQGGNNKEKNKTAAQLVAEIKDKVLGGEQGKLKGEIEAKVKLLQQQEEAAEQTRSHLQDLMEQWEELRAKRNAK